MTVRASGAPSYRQLFGMRGFAQLAAGTVLARTATQLWQVALILFVLQRFHSPALAGVAAFLSIAPGLAVSPVAGALLDRQGRLRMILLDYAVASTSLVVLFALVATGHLSRLALLLIVAVSSLTGPLSASGIRTLFPLVVPRELWDRANGVDSGSQALATVVGPALAGLLVAWVGGEGAFLATAGVYLLGALVLVGVADPQGAPGRPESLLRASWQALTFVLRHATLRGIMLTLFTGNVGFGMLLVAMPVLVFGRFHWGAGAVGELWSVAGAATVAAGLLVGRINTEGRERRLVAFGMVLLAVGCTLLAVARSLPALVAAMVMLGISSAPIDIGLFALRQRRTDPRWFGRAFAVSMSLNFAGVPVGSALAGPIVERSMLLALGVAAAVSLLAGVVPFLTIPRE
jgi:MFS family permease